MNTVNAIAQLIADQALSKLTEYLTIAHLVHCDYSPTPAMAGDTVSIPLIQGDLSNSSFVLNKHMSSSFLIPDITKALRDLDLLEAYMIPAAIALAEAIDNNLLELSADFAAVGKGEISEETLRAVAAFLPGNEKYLALSPRAYGSARRLPCFEKVTESMGKFRDLFIFRSCLVNPLARRDNVAFGLNSFALIMRRAKTEVLGVGSISAYAEKGGFGLRATMSYCPNTLAQHITLDLLYGVGVLRGGIVRVNA